MELRLLTTIDLTTLAAACLASGDADTALNYAHRVMTILDECRGEGPEFPQRDYFICYQVLSTVGQEEAARAALRPAYNLVTAMAEKITDPIPRQSFLEQVLFNGEIVREYARMMCEA